MQASLDIATRKQAPPTLFSACLKGKNTPPIHFPMVPSFARNGCSSWWTRLHNQNGGKARGHPRLHSNQETLLRRFKEYQREENKFPPGLCRLTAGSNQRKDGCGIRRVKESASQSGEGTKTEGRGSSDKQSPALAGSGPQIRAPSCLRMTLSGHDCMVAVSPWLEWGSGSKMEYEHTG